MPAGTQIVRKLFQNQTLRVLTDSLSDALPAKQVFKHRRLPFYLEEEKKGMIM
jgi:hypothetical protein